MPKPQKPQTPKPQIRVYISEESDKLLKIIAAFKDSSVNALVNEAIEHWFEESEQQRIIDRHRLNEIDEPE